MEERLQKIISMAGIASRRKAEDLIRDGKVSVNGTVIRILGTKADAENDNIKVAGKLIHPEPLEYFAFYKPQGVVTSLSDPEGRPVVSDYFTSKRRVYPAGRLDFNSEGLVIMTNDGAMTKQIMTAGSIPKVYRVKVQEIPNRKSLDFLRRGARLKDGTKLAPCRIKLVKHARNPWLEVTLTQGKNRIIRRMFEEIGHFVMKLRRVSIGPVTLGTLKAGSFRKLKPLEIRALKETKEAAGKGRNSGPKPSGWAVSKKSRNTSGGRNK
jgi:23S rRNA pseudouridine2605 synthase